MTTTDNIILAKGNHLAPPKGCDNPERCLFEWYNWLTRQCHTDSCPPGVSPVLHTFGMRLNDCLPDAKRQELKRFLPNGVDRLAGTADDGKDETRALIAANWALHTGARAWLAAAGLDDETAALDALPAITDRATLSTALSVIRGIRNRLWDKHAAAYTDLRAKVRAKLAETGSAAAAAVAAADADAAAAAAAAAVADAAAVAVAVAVADAAADAAAAAVAVADAAAATAAIAIAAAAADAAVDAVAAVAAAADAAAATAADAAAVAVAVAAAAAIAVADADADADAAYSKIYKAAYSAAKSAVKDKHGPAVAGIQDSAIALYDVLITGEWAGDAK